MELWRGGPRSAENLAQYWKKRDGQTGREEPDSSFALETLVQTEFSRRETDWAEALRRASAPRVRSPSCGSLRTKNGWPSVTIHRVRTTLARSGWSSSMVVTPNESVSGSIDVRDWHGTLPHPRFGLPLPRGSPGSNTASGLPI